MAGKGGGRLVIHPVVLSGGAGTRLWPMSRTLMPKQLLALDGERTLLEATLLRVQGAPFAAALVACNAEHRHLVAEQVRAAGIAAGPLVLEPEGRDTAPAAAVAALMLAAENETALMLVLPSDHVVRDVAAFRAAVTIAAAAAGHGALVTFGITPRWAETGFGYILRGQPWPGANGCFRVERFVEKPNRDTAEAYLTDGRYAWNSGMFLFRAAAYLDELERLQPGIVAAASRALKAGRQGAGTVLLDGEAFAAAPRLSIDHAVMERTRAAAVVPTEIGWSDVGSWAALWEIADRDGDGNVLKGDVVARGVSNSYVRSTGRLVAVVGLEDAVVVATEDAVLVANRERVQEVKTVAEALQASGRAEASAQVCVERPWGHYRTLDRGQGFQVKHIMVKPGAKLSLQMHHRRAEHWVVVSGRARVVVGEAILELGPNQGVHIPAETKHRLENVGEGPLRVIEVQSGDYLGEDDIVRFEDAYGRA